MTVFRVLSSLLCFFLPYARVNKQRHALTDSFLHVLSIFDDYHSNTQISLKGCCCPCASSVQGE